jgi:hypothetical protein
LIDRYQPAVQCAPALQWAGNRARQIVAGADAGAQEGRPMFDFRDLFQWERFITPSIIRVFYWLAVVITLLSGLSAVASGLALLPLQPLTGLFVVVLSVIGTLTAVIFVRIVSEFVLITFRINEHLGAIRNRDVR